MTCPTEAGTKSSGKWPELAAHRKLRDSQTFFGKDADQQGVEIVTVDNIRPRLHVTYVVPKNNPAGANPHLIDRMINST